MTEYEERFWTLGYKAAMVEDHLNGETTPPDTGSD